MTSLLSPIRIRDLHGPHLAYWVAQAENIEQTRGIKLYVAGFCLYKDSGLGGGVPFHYRPDSDGAAGQYLIERERIRLLPQEPGGEVQGQRMTRQYWLARHPTRETDEFGATSLEAAMRAYLASIYGDTVPHDGSTAAVFPSTGD